MRAEIVEPVLCSIRFGTLAAVVDLRKRFSAGELRTAAEGLVHAIPVLGCRYETRFWRDRWVPLNQIDWDRVVTVSEPGDRIDEATRLSFSTPVDVQTGIPLRLTGLNHAGGCRLILRLPHLVADGAGALAVLGELAAQLTGAGHPAPISMNRSLYQIGRALTWTNLHVVLSELGREIRRVAGTAFLSRWTPEISPATGEKPQVDTRRVVLDEAATARLVDLGRREGATVNDLLVTLALHGVAGRCTGGRVGTVYTINLRRYLDHPGPIVANLSGIAALTLPWSDARQAPAALAKVVRLTNDQKSRLPGLASNLLPLVLFGWLTHGLLRGVGRLVRRSLLGGGHRLAVMTNVGVMDAHVAAFKDDLADAWLAGPFVPGFPSPIALATSFRGRLSVTLCGHDAAATGLIDELAASWRTGFDSLLSEPTRKQG